MKRLKRGLGRGAMLLAVAAMGGVGIAGAAHAFTYTTGDLIGIAVKNDTELIVNLGNAFSPSSPITLPTQFSGDLSGANIITLAVPDNSISAPNVLWSADPSVDVLSAVSSQGAFTFSGDISNAAAALDQSPSLGWLNGLNGFPVTGNGVISNTADVLVLSGSQAISSYSNVLNGSGTNQINLAFPFSVAVVPDGTGLATIDLWSGQPDTANPFTNVFVSQFGTISAQDNHDGTMSYAFSVPEPGTLLLLGSGLLGLAVVGRRSKSA